MLAQDPDGDGPVEAILVKPITLANQPGVVAAINGNAFAHQPPLPPGQKPEWREGTPVDIVGWAKNGYEQRSRPQPGYWSFWLDGTGRARIGNLAEPVEARLAIAGFGALVVDGIVVAGRNGELHPRTAIGIDRTGQQIVMVVVDGRQRGFSEGVSTFELAELMIELGCHDAINLDGGGTSAMLRADNAGRLRVVNSPAYTGTRPTPVLLVVRHRAR